jgi:hypothetical protein
MSTSATALAAAIKTALPFFLLLLEKKKNCGHDFLFLANKNKPRFEN